MNKKELSDVFLDVRESYRLLYEFQKRVIDIVKYSGNYFEFDYHGGWPWYSNATPQRGRGKLDNWSWDWLNMYLYDFHFKSKEIEGKKVIFSILLQSDTGYYDSRTIKKSNIKKNDIPLFESTKKSQTRLIFKAGYEKWDMETLFEKGVNLKDELELSQESTKWELKNEKSHIIAKAYNLVEFLDKNLTNEKLLDFESYCNENQIKIKEKNEV